MSSTEAKPKTRSKKAPQLIVESPPLSTEERLDYISTAAYYRAEARQFEQGQELDDWLGAEAEFNARQ